MPRTAVEIKPEPRIPAAADLPLLVRAAIYLPALVADHLGESGMPPTSDCQRQSAKEEEEEEERNAMDAH